MGEIGQLSLHEISSQICRDLNIDRIVENAAFENYTRVAQNYVLEVRKTKWSLGDLEIPIECYVIPQVLARKYDDKPALLCRRCVHVL